MQNKINNCYRQFILIIIFILFLINGETFGEDMQNITLKTENAEYEAVLYNNSTVKELIKNFPMTITMSDLHENEKYYNLSKKFPTLNESVSQINKGDIMLFGDNCLVIFYKSFSTYYRYTRLGYIKNSDDLENSFGKGDIRITFEIK